MTLSCSVCHNCFENITVGNFWELTEDGSRMIFFADINMTVLPNLVDKTPSVQFIWSTQLSSIDQNIGQQFCRWTKLNELSIAYSFLKTLPSRFLLNCQNLNTLNLKNDWITEIAHDTFENLSNVSILDLSRNFLRFLHKDTFKPLINCLIINLEHNYLHTIHADLFDHNPLLWRLYLNHNDLKTIQRSFHTLKQLKTLYIDHNPHLDSIDLPDVAYGLTVYVSYCNLKEIYVPNNIISIHAMHNKISRINFQPHSILQYLDVSHNNLTDIADQISIVKSVGKLIIDYNPNQSIRIDEMKKIFPNLYSLSYSVFHGMNFQQYMEMDKNCEQHGIIFGLQCIDAWGEVHKCRIIKPYDNRLCECLLPYYP